MRTTLNLDDELVRQAQEYTGIREKTALIHEALRQIVAREAGRRLAALGGTMPEICATDATAQFTAAQEIVPGGTGAAYPSNSTSI